LSRRITVYTPRVLKDGSDSVGALGALNRVYINIGVFSEEWLLHFNALVGGKPITPITIADSRKNSSYFEATENQTLNMALFFLKTTDPHYLKDAPGGPGLSQHRSDTADTRQDCLRRTLCALPLEQDTAARSGSRRCARLQRKRLSNLLE
jgi:hypothetical protein